MEVLIDIWALIINVICYILVGLSAAIVAFATVFVCLGVNDELEVRSRNQPSPAGWLKRKRWLFFSLIIFGGFILLNADFLLYAVFPWNGGLWGVFK
jgi:hypothetical protein